LEEQPEVQDVRLIFRSKKGSSYSDASGQTKDIFAKVDDIEKWFKKYKIDTIELYLEAAVQTGKLVELFVSAEGKGGVKVVLKPNTNGIEAPSQKDPIASEHLHS